MAWGGPGGHERFLLLHISSSYAKLLGEKLFRTWEFLQSGSKAKDGEKKEERKNERLNDGNNNGQATHGASKQAWRTQAAWAKSFDQSLARSKEHFWNLSYFGKENKITKL